MRQYKLYEVGGCVRDKLLGLKSKDIDYAFEFTPETIEENKQFGPEIMYLKMNEELEREGFEIFLKVPECFTTRAKFPKGHEHENLVADFVMCRKETYPDPDSRKPVVEIGTIYDDLERRDGNFNAIAIDEQGNYIDPFGGIQDIKDKIIRCPISALQSLTDDPLRAIRFGRFSVTKGFSFSEDVKQALFNNDVWEKFFKVVSHERIREEVFKMFKYDTYLSLEFFRKKVPTWVEKKIFTEILWLRPTMESK